MEEKNLVDFENLKIDTKLCISEEEREKYMEYSMSKISARLNPGPDRGHEHIAVVCFGPSLKDDVEKIRNFKYIITCSGSHKYLIDRGIIPTWHVDVDPRAHKAKMLGDPHPDVEYLLSSSINPVYVDKLINYNVKLWHGYTGIDLENIPIVFPRGEWVFTGGCTVGLRALILARFLGFTHLDVFGMDCSYPENHEGEHADIHPNPCKDENKVVVEHQGIKYHTSYAMIEYARQFFNEISCLPDIKLSLHGVGFLQHLAFSGWKPNNVATVREESIIAFNSPELISKYYIEQNKLLHESNQYYGVSGQKYKDEVLRLSKEYETQNILDYGCGKGTLAASLPFEISEYDPAIEGKDTPPGPADLVICTDVLEHIEPDYLEHVLSDIARCTKKVAYLVINTGPAIKTLPDGRNTHLIQQPKTWWWKKIDEYFIIEDMYEKQSNIHVLAKRKHKSLGSIEVVDKETLSFNYVEAENIKFVVVNKHTKNRASTIRTKEPATIEWLESLNSEDILLDVGANVGVYSLWAAKNRNVKVYAFEPESQNYAILTQNIYINQLSNNVSALCLSISDKTGIGKLNLTEFNPGSSCHQFDTDKNYKGEITQFTFEQASFSTTIDDLVENNMIVQPTHIKIDVDGLEPKVIMGALKTLKNVNSLCIEVNPHLQDHLNMLKLLDLMGFVFDPEQVEKSKRKAGAFKDISEYVFRRIK